MIKIGFALGYESDPEVFSELSPRFADVVNSKELPASAHENVSSEYVNGKSGYKSKAKLLSKLSNQKIIKITQNEKTFFLIAFPELVNLLDEHDGQNLKIQNICDVIQLTQQDAKAFIIPKNDIEGGCKTYFSSKPMIMDLNRDGYMDVVFFADFEQPQVGGITSASKVFLFNPLTQLFCYSSSASDHVDFDLKYPKKAFDQATLSAEKNGIKLHCDPD